MIKNQYDQFLKSKKACQLVRTARRYANHPKVNDANIIWRQTLLSAHLPTRTTESDAMIIPLCKLHHVSPSLTIDPSQEAGPRERFQPKMAPAFDSLISLFSHGSCHQNGVRMR